MQNKFKFKQNNLYINKIKIENPAIQTALTSFTKII